MEAASLEAEQGQEADLGQKHVGRKAKELEVCNPGQQPYLRLSKAERLI